VGSVLVGQAWLGLVRLGVAGHGRRVRANSGRAGLGRARQVQRRMGKVGLGSAWQAGSGWASQGKSVRGWAAEAGWVEAVRGKARPGRRGYVRLGARGLAGAVWLGRHGVAAFEVAWSGMAGDGVDRRGWAGVANLGMAG